MKGTRTRFAQNKIDYIVYGNPKGTAQMVYDFGYAPPKDPHDLVRAAKFLIKENGKKAIKELIKIHPDKKAILKVQKAGKEDNFCGACHSYSYNGEDNFCGVCGFQHYDGNGNRQGFISQLVDLSKGELEDYYQYILAKSNEDPENNNLAEEVEMTWNELRGRKTDSSGDNLKDSDGGLAGMAQVARVESLVILGLVFAAGFLVGHSLKQGD